MQSLTYCRICEAACGLRAEHDASGAVIRLLPDPEHPISRGFVCAKGTRFVEVARHPERLREPLWRRPDGGYEVVSWPRAEAILRERLRPLVQRYGPHSIAVFFGNPPSFCTTALASTLLFVRRLGTRNLYTSASQDCANKFAGAREVHGSPVIHPIPDLDNAQLAVMFGTNPAVSQSSFVHLREGSQVFARLLARGGHVVWIDPRRTESAQRWGEHLPLRAGSDVYLMLALLQRLAAHAPTDPRVEGFADLLALAADYPAARCAELTDVPAERIEALARRIEASPRTAFHMSVGVNQGPFGTLCYALLHALAWVTGNLDAEGGSLFHPWAAGLARLFRFLGVDAAGHTSRLGGHPTLLDALPGGVLADEILTDGPTRIRALVCIGGDPVQSIPGGPRLAAALAELDVLVGVDLFRNHTTRNADLLLPVPSWLERWDVSTTAAVLQTHGLLPAAGPLQAPVGACRPEHEILAALSIAVGRPLLGSAWLTRFVFDLPWSRWLSGAQRWALALWGGQRPQLAYGWPVARPRAGRYLGRGPLTPGRRLRLWTSVLAREAARLPDVASRLRAADFVLIGRRRRIGHNSWLHGAVRDGDEAASAWLSPEDHEALGRCSRVRLSAGERHLEIPVAPHPSVPRGHVSVPHGLRDHNVNALLACDAIEAASGQLWMTGVPVRCQAVAGG